MSTLTRPRYDDDFHLWALDQTERLRATAEGRPELSGRLPQGCPYPLDRVLSRWLPGRAAG